MKPIGYYACSPAAQTIESEFGAYCQPVSTEQIKTALAICAANSAETRKVIATASKYSRFIAILESATDNQRLDLVPYFSDILKSR